MPGDEVSRSEVETRLAYTFSNKQLLRRALTHSSAISPGKRIEQSYQRLEFLGDRVLGLVVADLLFQRAPQANEGELSRTLNSVVRKESCAEVARSLDLGAAIYLGTSEARTGGADKEAILGDVCEAIIGAIYCDGGLDGARDFIKRAFSTHLSDTNAHRADAKTSLQEWAQGRRLPTPTYTETARTGPDHAPLFSISVSVEGFDEAMGQGPSKKIAEHKAALSFLKREAIWDHKQ